jgi:hypothetical protein
MTAGRGAFGKGIVDRRTRHLTMASPTRGDAAILAGAQNGLTVGIRAERRT